MLTLYLAIVLLLILLNGFFAMAEIALVSARPARLQPLAAEGSAGAEAALELKADPSRLLATVQIGITIIAVLLGTFGEATLGERLQDYLGEHPGFLADYGGINRSPNFNELNLTEVNFEKLDRDGIRSGGRRTEMDRDGAQRKGEPKSALQRTSAGSSGIACGRPTRPLSSSSSTAEPTMPSVDSERMRAS
jgi:hypothetical protein